jgi:hypothetical protein
VSNARIVERLEVLAEQLELGEITVSSFTDQLLGHTEALDRMSYGQLKEAQLVRAQLWQAIDQGNEQLVDIHAVGDWLRQWLRKVPVDPPDQP